MIRTGEALENPVTGEILIFHRTSADTDGDSVLVRDDRPPRRIRRRRTRASPSSERFEVLEGSICLRIGHDTVTATAGDVRLVEAGTPHRFWNAGETQAHFLCEVRPALGFESLIETMFALAAEGKTNKRGMPNRLQLAVIAQEHFDTVRLPLPPAWMQRAALAVGAPVGGALGYRPTRAWIAPRSPHVRTQPTRTYDRGRPHEAPSTRR